MPVAVGVPPLSVLLLVALALSSPWVVAGILLLRTSNSGRLLALVLTVPSVPLVLLFGGGAIDGLNFWLRDRTPKPGIHEGLISVIVFTPFTLLGLMFCLTVWQFQFLYWRTRKNNRIAALKTP